MQKKTQYSQVKQAQVAFPLNKTLHPKPMHQDPAANFSPWPEAKLPGWLRHRIVIGWEQRATHTAEQNDGAP